MITDKKYPSILQDRLVDRPEAASLIGLKEQTLALWAMSGKNLPVVKLGRRVKYRLSDIEAFVERSTRPATV